MVIREHEENVENTSRRRAFSTFLECSQMTGEIPPVVEGKIRIGPRRHVNILYKSINDLILRAMADHYMAR